MKSLSYRYQLPHLGLGHNQLDAGLHSKVLSGSKLLREHSKVGFAVRSNVRYFPDADKSQKAPELVQKSHHACRQLGQRPLVKLKESSDIARLGADLNRAK